MNRAEAKREAHAAIAALIRVHLEFHDNDLTAVPINEGWTDADADRYLEACSDIADFHGRMAPRRLA
jgi:hypothetical protein